MWKKQWGPQYWDQTWAHPPGTGKKKPRKADKEKPQQFVGYDGTRLSWPSSSSSGGASSQQGQSSEIFEIKQFLKDFAVGKVDSSHPLLRKMAEDDEKNRLRADQRALNQRRKIQRRLETVQKQLIDKEKAFTEWKQQMKDLVKKEGERHQEAMTKLKQELEKLQQEEPDQNDEEMGEDSDQSSSSEDNGTDKTKHSRHMREVLSKLDEAEKKGRQLAQHNMELQQTLQDVLQYAKVKERENEQEVEPNPPDGDLPKTKPPYVTSPSHPDTSKPSMTPFGKTPSSAGKHRSEPYQKDPGGDNSLKNGSVEAEKTEVIQDLE